MAKTKKAKKIAVPKKGADTNIFFAMGYESVIKKALNTPLPKKVKQLKKAKQK